MKHLIRSIPSALLTVFILTACGGGGDAPADLGGSPLLVDAAGVSTIDSTALNTTLTALPIETLSAAEKETLAFMREEEKLAHDIYTELALRWSANTRVFDNIARSESTHTEAIRQLLLRYALPDPAASLGAGVYQNDTLQALHKQLLASGMLSLVDALKVGAAIEEIDMIDINKALQTIDNQDIVLVYENLLKGSRNHLRSFVNTLANQGVTYVPQYMATADYQAIVSAPIEPG